jgi:Carboxypeptidase regulatory-like domain
MRRLPVAFLVLLSVAALSGQTQPPPRDLPPLSSLMPKAGTGRIAGRVVSEANDPLRNARVVLSPAGGDVPVVFTDGDGRFAFGSLPPATYTLSATKSGYAGSFALSRLGLRRPVVVPVDDGVAVTGVTVSLARGAAIAGRLLDDLGEPVANGSIFVERLVETGGVRSTRERRTVVTDDAGEYRAGSLPEGDYVVSRLAPPTMQVVRIDNQVFVTQQPSVPRPGGNANPADFGPPRVFFPGVTALSEAEVVSLKTGEERLNLDLVGPRPQLPGGDAINLLQGTDRAQIARDPAAKATSAIRGRILGVSGPLVGAEVRLTGDAIRPIPVVYSDALGQYEFTDLPAGVYTLSARKSRYLPRTLGQDDTADRGGRLTLAADERRDRADIILPRTSAITGQLADEYGDPIEGVTIRLQRIRFVSGRRRLVEVPGASNSRTDDQGRYRIFGLQPGSYIVAAYAGQLVLGQPDAADIPGYATTYFPGTANPSELRLVPVPASQDVEGMNFSLSRTPTAAVSGVARSSTGEPITGGLLLNSSRRSAAVATTPVGARIQPDGSFEFPNVAPGQYVIQAYRGRVRSSTEGEFAALSVTVNGTDVKDLLVQTSPGSTITGRITFDGPGPPALRNFDVSAVPSDADLAPLDGNFARADIHDDWTFEMSGISGPRRLRLLRAPRGWGLKQILVAGVDMTDTPLPFGSRSQSLSDVEVVLTDRITEITGTVTNDRGRAVADARVVAFASDPDLWYDRSRFLKITASDANGAFSIRDLPPGVYFVAGVDRRQASEENGEWLDPDLLDSLTTGAARITLSEGQSISANPTLRAR